MCMCVRSYGDAAHCRKALHRAVQCTSDYPEHVCEVLLNFERVEGELNLWKALVFLGLLCILTAVVPYRFFGRLGCCGAENRDQTQPGE